MKKLLGALAAVGAACNGDMLFSVGVVKEAGYKVAVQGNALVAYGAFPPHSRLHLGITVGAAHYDAELMGHVHGAVNPAVEVNTLG